LAAETQPKLQKLLWRIRVALRDRDFSQEDQKDRRREQKREIGGRAAAGGWVLRCAPHGAASNQTF
jgi:hypothetical protein